MSEKNFNKTAVEAQRNLEERLIKELTELKNGEIFSSSNHALISMDKMVDALPSDILATVKQHIDNVYYHIGVMKGCAK